MSLQTACAHCGKPYRAADSMAGKRVRCRDCGGVFVLTRDGPPPTAVAAIAPPPKPEPARPPNGVNAASPSGELAADALGAFKIPAAAPPTQAPPPRPSRAADTPNPLDAPDLTADSDAVFAQAFSQSPPPTLRPNYIHNFPYAYLMDRWVPPIAIGVPALGLLLRIVLGNESGVVWAIPLRLALAVAGFVLIAIPLGWIGMTIGCRWGGFARPPSPLYRVVAATWFPYALLLLLWLLAGSLTGAIPGVFVSLVAAGGLAWLLYRPQPEESLQSMAAATAAFVLTVVICTASLIGLNAAAVAIARDNGSPAELVSSPVGPGLAWEIHTPVEPPAIASHESPPPVDPPAIDPGPVDPPPPHTAPTPATTPTPAPVQPPPMPSDPPTTRPIVTPRPVTPATIASAAPDPLESSRLFGPASQPSPAPVDPAPDPSPPPEPTTPATPPKVAPNVPTTGDPLGDRIAAARSPLVSKVVATGDIGTFERAVFPATPSPMALLVRPAGGFEGDALEVWNLATQARVGSRLTRTSAQRDGSTASYAVSPDGQLVAKIDSFPTLGIELISFTDAPAPPRAAFPKTFGQARLVGFLDAARLLVRWEDNEKCGLQVVDIRRQSFGKGIDIPSSPLSPARFAIHPDGRMFAAVMSGTPATGEPRAELLVIDTQSGQSRQIPIQGIDKQWAAAPTGVSFAADGRKLAILYEREGKAAILWLALDGRTLPGAMQQFRAIVPPEIGTAPPEEGMAPATSRLESLNNGRFWLVGGNAVIDADTGKLHGLLGVPELIGSRAIADAVAIIRDDDGPRRLVIVRLASPATQPATAPAR